MILGEISIVPLPRLTRWTLAAAIHRVEDARPPAACYDCREPFLALAPWRGRLLCGYCAALAKLRER